MIKVGDRVRPRGEQQVYVVVDLDMSRAVVYAALGGVAFAFHPRSLEVLKPVLVVIESPFGSKFPEIRQQNEKYRDECLADSLKRGEAPYASHAIYPSVLDDNQPNQRRMGMEAGFAWGEKADLVAVYIDRGISPGMVDGIKRAEGRGQKIEYRSLRVKL